MNNVVSVRSTDEKVRFNTPFKSPVCAVDNQQQIEIMIASHNKAPPISSQDIKAKVTAGLSWISVIKDNYIDGDYVTIIIPVFYMLDIHLSFVRGSTSVC